MPVNQIEYAWENITVTAMGRTFERITAIDYDTEVDKKHIYGRGSKPKGVQPGREKPSGSLTLGQSEIEAMTRVAQATNKTGKITDLVFDIQVHYLVGTDIVKDKIFQATLMKQPKEMKEGDAEMTVKCPFICTDILYNQA
jgi:hypothetical protein